MNLSILCLQIHFITILQIANTICKKNTIYQKKYRFLILISIIKKRLCY